MASRITQLLPPEFSRDPVVIADRTYVGVPRQPGRDNHAHTPERTDRPTVYLDCTFDANGADEAFKLSRHYWVAAIGCTLRGGAEDCLDIVRGAHLWFVECNFKRGLVTRQEVTIKGGARDVHFVDCTGLASVVAGEYTKYDHHAIYPGGKRMRALPWRCARPPVRELHFHGCVDPVPLVRLLHAEDHRGTAIGDRRWRWAVPLYFWGRSLWPESSPAPAEEFMIDTRELA